MKEVLSIIGQFFSRKYGLTVSQINFKLTIRGQIKYCTGHLDSEPNKEQVELIEKAYRKHIACMHYAFLNTELSITRNKFSILNLNTHKV